MTIQINPLYLASIVVVWLLVYHITYWLVAMARDSSLVCLAVGLFGFSAIALREPRKSRTISQFLFSGLALAAVAYLSLYILRPGPVAGLNPGVTDRVATILIPVVALSLLQLLVVVRERRFPIWGEARVLASVQRSLATGALVIFTPLGRTFLRERYGATPGEFLRMVRS